MRRPYALSSAQVCSPHSHLNIRTVRPFRGLSIVRSSAGFSPQWLHVRTGLGSKLEKTSFLNSLLMSKSPASRSGRTCKLQSEHSFQKNRPAPHFRMAARCGPTSPAYRLTKSHLPAIGRPLLSATCLNRPRCSSRRLSALQRIPDSGRTASRVRNVPGHKVAALQPAARGQEPRERKPADRKALAGLRAPS
jgi:hypothetical protein